MARSSGTWQKGLTWGSAGRSYERKPPFWTRVTDAYRNRDLDSFMAALEAIALTPNHPRQYEALKLLLEYKWGAPAMHDEFNEEIDAVFGRLKARKLEDRRKPSK